MITIYALIIIGLIALQLYGWQQEKKLNPMLNKKLRLDKK